MLVRKERERRSSIVEAEVEAYAGRFFDTFSKDYTLTEKPMLQDLQQTIDKELLASSNADDYLFTVVDAPKAQSVIEALFDLKMQFLKKVSN